MRDFQRHDTGDGFAPFQDLNRFTPFHLIEHSTQTVLQLSDID